MYMYYFNVYTGKCKSVPLEQRVSIWSCRLDLQLLLTSFPLFIHLLPSDGASPDLLLHLSSVCQCVCGLI